jgi:hypothetical protein
MKKLEIGDDDELSVFTAVPASERDALPERPRQQLGVRADDRHVVVLR